MRRNRNRDQLLRERLHERFVVTVTTGETFNGLLGAVDDRSIVLVDAGVMRDAGSITPVDGEVVLRRESIAYMQRPQP